MHRKTLAAPSVASPQAPCTPPRAPRGRRRLLASIAGLLALTAALTACTPEQMRAWFDAQGIDHSTMSEADVQWYADAATAYWESAVTTTAPPTTAAPARPALPSFLICVRWRESRDNYQAYNASSGASGAFQFMQATWNNTASHAGRYDLVGQQPRWVAPHDQDLMAIHLYQWQGRSPWVTGPGC